MLPIPHIFRWIKGHRGEERSSILRYCYDFQNWVLTTTEKDRSTIHRDLVLDFTGAALSESLWISLSVFLSTFTKLRLEIFSHTSAAHNISGEHFKRFSGLKRRGQKAIIISRDENNFSIKASFCNIWVHLLIIIIFKINTDHFFFKWFQINAFRCTRKYILQSLRNLCNTMLDYSINISVSNERKFPKSFKSKKNVHIPDY